MTEEKCVSDVMEALSGSLLVKEVYFDRVGH